MDLPRTQTNLQGCISIPIRRDAWSFLHSRAAQEGKAICGKKSVRFRMWESFESGFESIESARARCELFLRRGARSAGRKAYCR